MIEKEGTGARQEFAAEVQRNLRGESQPDFDPILFPMKRIKGRWKQISWEEAFEIINKKHLKMKQ